MRNPAGYVVEPSRWLGKGGIRVEDLDAARVYPTRHGAKTALGQERRLIGAKWAGAEVIPVRLAIALPSEGDPEDRR